MVQGHYHNSIIRRTAVEKCKRSIGDRASYVTRQDLITTDGKRYTAVNNKQADLVCRWTVREAAGMPESDADLWQSLERAEKRSDSQLALEHEITLPNFLTNEEAEVFARNMCRKLYPGCTYTAGIHRPRKYGIDNLHVHVVVTQRHWDTSTGAWAARKPRGINRGKVLRAEKAIYCAEVNKLVVARAQRLGIEPDLWTTDSYKDQFKAGLIPFEREPSRHCGVHATLAERQEVRDQVAYQDKLAEDLLDARQQAQIARNRADWYSDQVAKAVARDAGFTAATKKIEQGPKDLDTSTPTPVIQKSSITAKKKTEEDVDPDPTPVIVSQPPISFEPGEVEEIVEDLGSIDYLGDHQGR